MSFSEDFPSACSESKIIILYISRARIRISVKKWTAFEDGEHFLKAIQIFGRIVVDINSALFVVADEGDLGSEHRAHAFDERFEFGALGRGGRGFFRLKDFGRSEKSLDGAFRFPNGIAAFDRLLGKSELFFFGYGDESAGVSGGESAAFDQSDDLGRERQKPQGIGDGGTGFSDSRGDFVLRPAELGMSLFMR